MPQEKICGSTTDIAELIVDYEKPKEERIEIKDVPPKNWFNTLTTAYGDWLIYGFKYIISIVVVIGIVLVILSGFRNPAPDLSRIFLKLIIPLYLGIPLVLSIFHLNEKFDNKWKKIFAMKTGDKPKNRATFSNFRSNVFVLYDIGNIVINWDPSGDVEKQLTKVWVKKDPYSILYENQATTKGLLWLNRNNPNPIWNAYFFFKEIPKDGELYVEWI